MIVTWPIGIRLGLIVLLAVLLQIAFLAWFGVLGAAPELVPVTVAAVGLCGGALIGAVIGFCAGFLLDSALLQTLGVSSLVLVVVGYLAGRYRETFEIESTMAPALLAGGLTALAAAAFSAMQLTLGTDAGVSALLVREVIVKGLLGFALMFAVYPAVRLLLRPALVVEEPAGPTAAPRGRSRAGRRARAAGARRPRRTPA